jgi:small-conductance mechanosensitive channel
MAHSNHLGKSWRRFAAPKSCAILTLLLGSVFWLFAGVSNSADAPVPNSPKLIPFLLQTIEWYHQLSIEQQIATEPGDVVVVNNNRQITDEVVQLAFEFARAETDLTKTRASAGESGAQISNATQFQALMQMSAQLDQNVHELEGELESVKQKLETATGRKHDDLRETLAETQSELDLTNARREAVRNILQFVAGAGTDGLGATGLRAQVEALARSVPAALTKPTNTNDKSTVNTGPANTVPVSVVPHAEPMGIWELSTDILELRRKIHTLDESIQLTNALSNSANELKTPMVNMLTDLSKQGDELAKQADSADSKTLATEKSQLDALTGQFKQVTARVLPLSKQSILLGIYKKNISDWQGAITSQYRTELRGLLVRLAILAIVIGIVIVFSEIWKRAILRYVHDIRKRYQLLLLRKIIVWVAVVSVITFSFASQLTSIATFAGLLTAGVAVALQSVILSTVGYFFLIGKFGIRVGDRVQIADVTGEVVDIGLVRLHLMELGAGGASPPTGRVVSFPNSIVFQAGAGLFKQIPGTNFVWHEITFTFSPSSDWTVVEQRMKDATNAVFKEYSTELEQQQREMARTITSTSVEELRPRVQLHFVPLGLEVQVRYPVNMQESAEIDGRMTRELLNAIHGEPRLTLVGSDAESVRFKSELAPSNGR